MGELADEAEGGSSALDQTLAQFIFPGSANAGTYGIREWDPLDPFLSPVLACDKCMAGNPLRVFLQIPGVDVVAGFVGQRFAKSQKRTMLQQLQDGARAFDLRFFRATAADAARSPELVAGQFYIHRTLAGAPSTQIFADLATFLNQSGHDREIVLLNFSQMYEGSDDMGTASLESLFTQMRSTVGASRFAPENLGDVATLAQLAAQGRQVVVSYQGSTPLNDPAIASLVWPPIASRNFESPDVNPFGGYPKADTWKTEGLLLDKMRTLASRRPDESKMYQMSVAMDADNNSDFPGMLPRALFCNMFNGVITDTALGSALNGLLDNSPVGQIPTNLKQLLKDFVQDFLTGAIAAAAAELLLEGAGVCPAVNNDWDRFTSLEEVAGFTNPKLLPSLVGLRRNDVNIVLADYYTTPFTAEAKRLNQGAARLTVTIRNVAELECHDCLPPTNPDYYPEIVFRPNGSVAPANWHDWPYYPNAHETLDPGHFSQWGGPWLETRGRNINPNWRAMRSVAPTTAFVDVQFRIWDQDDNLCPAPLWCGPDDISKLNGSSTVVGFRENVWDTGTNTVRVGNRTAWSAGPTGFWVYDSSRVTYTVDVCQWSLIPGQPATTKLCGYAGFVGNTAPDAQISSFNLPGTPLEGRRLDVLGQGTEHDPTLNADGDPIGMLASWEWDCAYTGVPDEFELNRGCTNAETYFAPDGGEAVDPSPRGLRFYVTDGPANRVLAFRVTDKGGLTSPIATWPYTVTNDPPAVLFPQYTIVQDGNAQRVISTATFTDRGVEDGPFTCEWWDGPVGSGTLLPASVIVEDQGITYSLDIFGNDIATGQHKCTGTVDVSYGPHVIYFRVLDKDGAPSAPALGYARAITLTSNITLAAGLGSPALSNVNSPVIGNYTRAWTGAMVDGAVAAQSGVPGELEWSQMQATITGPGRLTFWWRISGDQYDELQFFVEPGQFNPTRFRNIFTDTVGWRQETVDILAGVHTLVWNFKNGFEGATNLGRGWVRDVVLTPVVITVSAPVVPGVWNELYPDTTFTQSGGTNPTTWAVTSGALPNGLTLSPAGLLSGTPTQVGEFPVTITATDSLGFFGSGPFTLSISPPGDHAECDGLPRWDDGHRVSGHDDHAKRRRGAGDVCRDGRRVAAGADALWRRDGQRHADVAGDFRVHGDSDRCERVHRRAHLHRDHHSRRERRGNGTDRRGARVAARRSDRRGERHGDHLRPEPGGPDDRVDGRAYSRSRRTS